MRRGGAARGVPDPGEVGEEVLARPGQSQSMNFADDRIACQTLGRAPPNVLARAPPIQPELAK